MSLKSNDINLNRSRNDLKEYRLMTLSSGLEILLVSTEKLVQSKKQPLESAKAAAAMCVQVGSFADPVEAEGLAHFLEHMVFMGSSKFPSENQYDQYISSHGGSCNAYTEGEHTVYQFDITGEYLPRALDMFASCFISPLFKRNATNRELEAIDSEFNLASTNDDVRAQQLFSSFAQSNHVLTKFSWGNHQSLKTVPKEKGIDMEVMLRSFHRTHYTPANMKLVVVAPQNLDILQKIVIDCFGGWNGDTAAENDAVAWLLRQEEEEQELKASSKGNNKSNGNGKKKNTSGAAGAKKQKLNASTTTRDSTQTELFSLKSLADILAEQKHMYQFPVHERNTAFVTKMIPIRASHRLMLVWQLPPLQHQYRNKNEFYVTHVLGHEGHGSIISHLKHRGLATMVEAGCNGSNMEANSLYTLLHVDISLTAKGIANWIYVVQVVIQYITMLHKIGPQERIFHELQQVAQLEYDYLDESSEEELAERLCVELSPLLARERALLLPSSFLLWDWDPKGIQEIVQALSPNHMHIMLLSPAYDSPKTIPASHPNTNINETSDKDEEEEAWSSESEDGSNDSEQEGAAEGKSNQVEEEAAPLSAVEIQSLFFGPTEWLPMVLPPEALPTGDNATMIATEIELPVLQTEAHFNTKYWQQHLPLALRQLWQATWTTATGDLQIMANTQHQSPDDFLPLYLPEPNPYIPHNLVIIPEDNPLPATQTDLPPVTTGQNHSSKLKAKIEINPEPIPQRVVDIPGLRVWHMLDSNRFPVPKVGIFLRLASPITSRNARQAALNDLTRLLLYDSLEKELYCASMAELTTTLASNDLGLEIKMKGFNDKAPNLLRTVLQRFTQPEVFVNEKSFQLQSEKLIRTYRNDGLKSSSAAVSARLGALKPTSFLSRQKSRYLRSPTSVTTIPMDMISREQTDSEVGWEQGLINDEGENQQDVTCITSACVIDFVKEFLQCVSVEVLVHGNTSIETVYHTCADIFGNMQGTMQDAVAATAPCYHLNATAYTEQVIVKLPQHIPTILQQKPRNPLEPSACVELYYQLGPFTLPNATYIDLLEQILYEPFFDQLRTKQQLGYSVSCSGRYTFGILGFVFSVVSSSYTVAEVQKAMLAYIANIPRYLQTMRKDDFMDHVDSLMNDRLQPPASLFDAFNNNLYSVYERRYDFDTRAEEVAILTAVNKDILSKFAQDMFSVEKRRVMGIQASLEAQISPLQDIPKEEQRFFTSPGQVWSNVDVAFWPNMA